MWDNVGWPLATSIRTWSWCGLCNYPMYMRSSTCSFSLHLYFQGRYRCAVSPINPWDVLRCEGPGDKKTSQLTGRGRGQHLATVFCLDYWRWQDDNWVTSCPVYPINEGCYLSCSFILHQNSFLSHPYLFPPLLNPSTELHFLPSHSLCQACPSSLPPGTSAFCYYCLHLYGSGK